jgi:hypothetical protein
MLLRLSRFRYVVEPWYYSCTFTMNVNNSTSWYAKWTLVSYVLDMLSSMILTVWILHRLSRYKHVIENHYDTCSFMLNVNSSSTRKCNNYISIVLYKYGAQQRNYEHANGSPLIEIWIDPWEAIQSQLFILNVNNSNSGQDKVNLSIIVYIYTVQ